MNGHYDNSKPDIFNFDEKRKAAFLEDVLVHNARLHLLEGERQAKCLENVVRVYAEFFKDKNEYRKAAREDFEICLDAHRDMLEEGLL
jgi:hypothetical protein